MSYSDYESVEVDTRYVAVVAGGLIVWDDRPVTVALHETADVCFGAVHVDCGFIFGKVILEEDDGMVLALVAHLLNGPGCLDDEAEETDDVSSFHCCYCC